MPPVAMAAAGAIAGSQKDEADSSMGVQTAGQSEFGNLGQEYWQNSLNALGSMVEAGPGQSDVAAGYGATKDFAAMLQQYSQGGYQPSDTDISSSNSIASKLFNPQMVAMQQAFDQQGVNANRQAALMGRSVDDPILRNKMAQEQTRQSAMLNAQQGAWSQQYALQQPMQRLNFAQQRTGVLQGLASQAMANRQALASMGSAVMNNDQSWRLATATRTGHSESGGGLKGALEGGMAGFGYGMNMGQGSQYQQPRSGQSAPNPNGGNDGGWNGSEGRSGGGYDASAGDYSGSSGAQNGAGMGKLIPAM